MRTGLVLAFVALLNLVVFVPVAKADVIPTRIDTGKSDSARVEVEQRLVEIGVKADVARAHVEKMTDEDVAYYSAHPNSQQMVSGLRVEEAILGLALLGLLGLIALSIVNDAK